MAGGRDCVVWRPVRNSNVCRSGFMMLIVRNHTRLVSVVSFSFYMPLLVNW